MTYPRRLCLGSILLCLGMLGASLVTPVSAQSAPEDATSEAKDPSRIDQRIDHPVSDWVPRGLRGGQLFCAADLPLTIPPTGTGGFPCIGGPTVSQIVVPNIGPITDVEAYIHLTHTFDADLDIELSSPSATIMGLSSDNGADGDDYGTTGNAGAGYPDSGFSDAALVPITSGTPPFVGVWVPEQSLGIFDGESSAGIWELLICDDSGGDSGTLLNYCLLLNAGPPARRYNLTLTKTGSLDLGGDGVANPGDVIDYDFAVENVGENVLTNIVVADPLVSPIGCPTGNPIPSLAPGATQVCSGTYAITQPDIDAEVVANMATATAPVPPDTADYCATDLPRTIPPSGTGGFPCIGGPTVSQIVVPDSGPIVDVQAHLFATHTFDADLDIELISPALTTVGLSSDNGADGDDYGSTANDGSGHPDSTFDDNAATPIGAGSPPFVGEFAPEEPLSTFAGEDSAGLWQMSICDDSGGDSGTLEAFCVTLERAGFSLVADDTDSETIPQVRQLSLQKTGSLDLGDDGVATPGDPIEYTFTVANPGNVTLSDVLVSDPLVAPITCPSGNPITSLVPGAMEVCIGSYLLTQADIDAGVVDNTAEVTGTGPALEPREHCSADSALPIPLTGTGGFPCIGGPTVSQIVVPDSGPIADVQAHVYLTHTFDADLDIELISPALTTVELSSDNGTDGDDYGTTANDGSGHPNSTFDDNAATPIGAGSPPFVGEFVPEEPLSTFAGEDAAGVWQMSICDDSGGDVGVLREFCISIQRGNTLGEQDSHSEAIPQVPQLGLEKTGDFDLGTDSLANAGDLIDYSFKVTNAGNVTITGILVSDPLVSLITCPSGNPIPSLAPGAMEVCTGTYVLTQADIDAGFVFNTADATGSDPAANPVSAQATLALEIPLSPLEIPALGALGLVLLALLLAGLGARRAWQRD